jgi:glycine cleavage system regulatory protein
MERSLVMTLIGPDKPGLVGSIAAAVADHGGNWEESRMSRLGGQFAGILRARVPAQKEAALLGALRALESQGLQLVLHPEAASPKIPGEELVSMEILGLDRPGIVSQISAALARRGVNVEELDTECAAAPMSGEVMFHASAKLRLPKGCGLSDVRDDLAAIAADLMVEVKIEPPQARKA